MQTEQIVEKHIEYLEKLNSESELFLLNDFEDAAIRKEATDSGEKWFVKFKGKPEFETSRSNKVVTDAILEYVTITKKEYDSF